jgi:dTDP-4-dehydrorhamnose 3,5-epimerase
MIPILITCKRLTDSRGWFEESWKRSTMRDLGIATDFCQDNHSYSALAGTIRGLHFQLSPCAQAKLVRCIRGRIFDVAVDIRHDSPSFGKWVAYVLSAENGNQLFIPSGYAHGFVTLEDDCEILYKVDNPYEPATERGIIWNDPAIGIVWPLNGLTPTLSQRDAELPSLADVQSTFRFDAATMQPLAD